MTLSPPTFPALEAVPTAESRPVFVDGTGRRRRLLRWAAVGIAGTCTAYLALLGIALGAGTVDPVTTGLPLSGVIAPLVGGGSKTPLATAPGRVHDHRGSVPIAAVPTTAPVAVPAPIAAAPPQLPLCPLRLRRPRLPPCLLRLPCRPVVPVPAPVAPVPDPATPYPLRSPPRPARAPRPRPQPRRRLRPLHPRVPSPPARRRPRPRSRLNRPRRPRLRPVRPRAL